MTTIGTSEDFGWDLRLDLSHWPYEPKFHEVQGVRLHYVDEGSGEPLLLLHGNPTWSFIWRRFIARLSGERRCVAPDHMGFGMSDTPHNPALYRLPRHIENLKALVPGST